jgi:hypothetical protein
VFPLCSQTVPGLFPVASAEDSGQGGLFPVFPSAVITDAHAQNYLSCILAWTGNVGTVGTVFCINNMREIRMGTGLGTQRIRSRDAEDFQIIEQTREEIALPFAPLAQRRRPSVTFRYRRSPGGIGKDCATERGPSMQRRSARLSIGDYTSTCISFPRSACSTCAWLDFEQLLSYS